jgi:glyoxylase I family protein
MPEIVGAGHIALTVRNVEASAQWYEALLGWPVIRRSGAGEQGSSLWTLYDPRSSLALSLFEPPDRSDDRFDSRRTGLDHLALRVANEEELYHWIERLDALQIERSQVRDAGGAVKFVAFEDPDGIRLEFFAHLSAGNSGA